MNEIDFLKDEPTVENIASLMEMIDSNARDILNHVIGNSEVNVYYKAVILRYTKQPHLYEHITGLYEQLLEETISIMKQYDIDYEKELTGLLQERPRTDISYDELVKRVLQLEMYIETQGLTIPHKSYYYPELLKIIESFYGDSWIMITESRRFPMGIETLDIIRKYRTMIDNLGITSEYIRWYQKPSKWPKFIQDYIREYTAKRYSKRTRENDENRN